MLHIICARARLNTMGWKRAIVVLLERAQLQRGRGTESSTPFPTEFLMNQDRAKLSQRLAFLDTVVQTAPI